MKQLEVKRKQVEYLAGMGEVILALYLSRKIGLEGMGVFLIPIAIYYFFWILTAGSYPDALGKMIRVKKSKGQYRNIQRIKTMALISQTMIGAVGSLAMLGLGSILAGKGFLCNYSVFLVQVLSPLVFFRCMTALFVGLTQGEGSELPAVVTSVLRVALIFGLGTVLGKLFQSYGEKISSLLKQEHYTSIYTGAGWCLGMVCGEAILVFVAVMCYLGTKKKKNTQEGEGMKLTDGFGTYLSLCFQNMKYRVLIQILEYLPVMLGMLFYYRKTSQMREIGYGTFFVGYFSLCILALYFLHITAVPFWGKIGGFIRHDDLRQARTCFHGGIHLLFASGLILCATITAMPMQVGALLGFTSQKLQGILAPGCFWILVMSLAFYFSRMLIRLGKSLLVVGISSLHVILYLLLFFILFKNQEMGLTALMYAGLIAGGVYAALLGAMTKQLLGGKLPVVQVFGMPVILALIITLAEVLLVKFLYGFLGNLLTVLIIGGIGMICFWCGLLLLHSFYEEEVRLIPGGKFLLVLGEMMEVF